MSINWNYEELAGMSPADQEAYIRSTLLENGIDDPEEIEEETEAFLEGLTEYQEELEETKDELQDLHLDGADEEEADELIDEIDAQIDALDEAEDTIADIGDELAQLNVDKTDGSDYNQSEPDFEAFNGQTVTVEMGGTGASIDDNMTDEEWLIDQGVTNEAGEVLKDMDGVPGLNYSDIEAALATRHDTLESQNVFLTYGTWELVSYDANGIVTFKVTNPDNPEEFIYYTFENAANVTFHFNGSTITQDYLDNTIKSSWPDDLKYQSYLGDDVDTIGEQMAPEVELSTRLAAIPGYNDAVDGLDNSSVTNYTSGTLSGTLQTKAEEALATLYSWLDDPSLNIEDLWDEILANWSGLSAADQALLVQYLTLTVATNDTDNFAALFGGDPSTIINLENILNGDGSLSQNDITCILVLENHANGAVGNYGGSTGVWNEFSIDGVNAGENWTDHTANAAAIEAYKQIMGANYNATADTAITNEETIAEAPDPETTNGYANLNTEWSDLYNMLIGNSEGEEGGDLSQKEWDSFISAVYTNLRFDENGNIDPTSVWQAIMAGINADSVGNAAEGAAVANLIVLIDKYASDAFKDAFFAGCMPEIKTWLKENGGDAVNKDDALDILKDY